MQCVIISVVYALSAAITQQRISTVAAWNYVHITGRYNYRLRAYGGCGYHATGPNIHRYYTPGWDHHHFDLTQREECANAMGTTNCWRFQFGIGGISDRVCQCCNWFIPNRWQHLSRVNQYAVNRQCAKLGPDDPPPSGDPCYKGVHLKALNGPAENISTPVRSSEVTLTFAGSIAGDFLSFFNDRAAPLRLRNAIAEDLRLSLSQGSSGRTPRQSDDEGTWSVAVTDVTPQGAAEMDFTADATHHSVVEADVDSNVLSLARASLSTASAMEHVASEYFNTTGVQHSFEVKDVSIDVKSVDGVVLALLDQATDAANEDSTTANSSSSRIGIIVPAVLGGLAVVGLLIGCCVFLAKRRASGTATSDAEGDGAEEDVQSKQHKHEEPYGASDSQECYLLPEGGKAEAAEGANVDMHTASAQAMDL